ncbi:MAG TPA: tetratricopeptide repeat protein, partial [Myxococcota bacterium]|nr:tetratricopeptide repeat protein [Myxococcota bacterium]
YQHHEEPAIASLRQAVNAITFDVPPQIRVSTRLSFALFSIKKKSWHEVKAILQPALEDITHPEVTTSMGAKVRLVYADALRHLNQHDEAAEHLQAAAEITSDPPSDPGLRRKVLESLAEVYEKLGRHAEKKKLRREAAALPGGPATDPPMLLDLNLSRPSPASTLRL